jgi:6-phosphogluconate dehydrogenase
VQIGMIGLGRMGGAMAQRLAHGGHHVVCFDQDENACQRARDEGLACAATLALLVGKLPAPRVLWLMLPAGDITEGTINALLPLLSAGDTVIDGGNANYQDTLRRANSLAQAQIQLVDCGTSGGVWGLAEGYSLMIGGDENTIDTLRPLFETLAPAKDRGWGRVGPAGAGHFTKMIHNGIEYGMMQAYAEGFAIMQQKTEFSLDLHRIATIWQHGSVVRSWLLDLTTSALQENPTMSGIAPYVDDSGEGRWAVAEAMALNVAAPVMTVSLLERIRSRDTHAFAGKLLAAMRNQFGGHAIRKE